MVQYSRYVAEPACDPSDPAYRHFHKIFEAFKVLGDSLI